VTIQAKAPVKIGVIQALSGEVAVLGREQVRGLQLALDRRGGEILGHPFSLRTEDTGCTPEGGANAALRIVSDPETVAIFGTTCSGDAASASRVMTDAGLSMISGNNSAPFLTSIGGQRAPKWQAGYFRTAPNEEFSGPAAARYAYEKLGMREAAVLNDGDIYTTGLTDGFKNEFERLGGRIVLNTSVNKADTDMGPVLTAVQNSGAKLLFFPLFQPEGNRVLLQARATPGFKNVVLMSDGSLIESSFIEAMGANAVGMYFVGPTPPAPSPALDRIVSEYVAKFKEKPPTIYYLSAFDAADILLDAIGKVAVKDHDGTLHIGRQALRDALYATKNREGVSGKLSCNKFGDCAPPGFDVLRLDDPALGVDGLKANVVFTYKPGKPE
jgi:branched-chain amino acid transport system substrate-binding protein